MSGFIKNASLVCQLQQKQEGGGEFSLLDQFFFSVPGEFMDRQAAKFFGGQFLWM